MNCCRNQAFLQHIYRFNYASQACCCFGMTDLEQSLAVLCLIDSEAELTLDFTEPTMSFESSGRSRHNVFEMASSSTGSPRRVPVPWMRVSLMKPVAAVSTYMCFEIGCVMEIEPGFMVC